jgi:TBC1 domain family protein 5
VSDPLNDQAEDNDILDVIKLDVERLFIYPLFEDAQVQQDIIQILFNYNKFNAYKQGFHEICGLVYLELYNDDHDNSNIKIETFNIFTSLMLSVVPNFYIEQSLIGWCISQFNRYLALVDESLYELLIKRHKIESQIWLIRWVRLLFMRELGIPNTLKILDYLICYDHDLSKLMPFIIIILLIKIKIRLVVCEDNVLQLLLHYPSTEFTHSEVKEIVDLSIKMYRVPEKDLPRCGLELNKRFIKEYNWDKLQDLDRLRMELKLQRGVRRALKR